jgi:hypothetical protein
MFETTRICIVWVLVLIIVNTLVMVAQLHPLGASNRKETEPVVPHVLFLVTTEREAELIGATVAGARARGLIPTALVATPEAADTLEYAGMLKRDLIRRETREDALLALVDHFHPSDYDVMVMFWDGNLVSATAPSFRTIMCLTDPCNSVLPDPTSNCGALEVLGAAAETLYVAQNTKPSGARPMDPPTLIVEEEDFVGVIWAAQGDNPTVLVTSKCPNNTQNIRGVLGASCQGIMSTKFREEHSRMRLISRVMGAARMVADECEFEDMFRAWNVSSANFLAAEIMDFIDNKNIHSHQKK